MLQIKSSQGNRHTLFIQELDLQKGRSIKILKTDLGELNSHSWIALVLLMKDIENNQNPRLAHFSSYEIKVFKNGMPKLNEFRFENMIDRF